MGSFQLTTATVVTEVEHQLLHALFLQVKKGAAHLLGTTLGKLCQADIANTVALHTVIRNRRCGTQRTTGNLHLHHLVRAGTPNLQCKGRSGLTSQMLPHILNTLAHHGRIINAQDDVTLAQSCFLGRCIPHRLINHRGLLLHVITNQRTYTPVLSREERFQLTGLRVIHRIRIQTLQHGFDARSHHLIRIQRIHIQHIQVAVEGVEDLQILHHLEVMILLVLSLYRHSHHQQERHPHYNSLHRLMQLKYIMHNNRVQKYMILSG